MKVGIIAHNYYPIKEPFKGGLEMFTHLLVKELVTRNHDVYTLCLQGSELMGKMVYYAELEHDLQKTSLKAGLNQFAIFHTSLNNFLSHGFDIIHNNTISHHAVVAGSLLDVPYVTSFHCPIFDNILMAINAVKERPNQTFTTVSQHLNIDYTSYLKNVRTIYNGIDLSKWKVATDKGDYFSWCGRICREKGLLEIMDLCSTNDLKLKIAGPVSDQEYFDEHIIPRLKEFDFCEYLGHLNQTQVNEMISQSKAFLFSSIWQEPYGMVIAEALASGTPVIANNMGAASEIITEKCGILFDVYDPDTFNSALLQLKTIEQADCRERAEKFCSHLKMVDNYEEIYRQITDKK